MRLHGNLLLAIFVLNARAASIPDQLQSEIQKDIINDEIKSPVENISSEQEVLDHADTVKDVQNNIRNSVSEDIPVQVILVEVQPNLKSEVDQEIVNEVSDDEIQRPIVDLKNPGPPQRQEHETQNPEHYEDAERTVTLVKEEIKETQALLRQNLQGLTEGIQDLPSNNEYFNNIQTSIQNMKDNFAGQIQKLNDTLQNFLNPNKLGAITSEQEVAQVKAKFTEVESRLKVLQNNFDNGVITLSEGVHVVANLRSEGGAASSEAPTSSSTAAPGQQSCSNPIACLMEMMGNFTNSISNSMKNVTQAITNYIPQNQNWGIQNIFQGGSTTASPQSDSSSTSQQSLWQNFQASINNVLNPNQGGQGGQQTGPFQNFPPFLQSVTNFFQPNKPNGQSNQKPSEASAAEKPAAEKPTAEKPAAEKPTAEKPAAEKPTETTPDTEKKPEKTGPIRQLLENNPVIQGINGAVQRIQNNINNPEKPRETEEKNETGQEKGGIIFVSGHNRPGGSASGDNIDIGSGMNADETKEIVAEEKVEDAVEVKGTEPVPEKTE